VNNGTLHYDHDKDGTLTQLAGCEAKVRNLQHDTWLAIRYENDVLSGRYLATVLYNAFFK
jgi:mannose-binding lectin 2